MFTSLNTGSVIKSSELDKFRVGYFSDSWNYHTNTDIWEDGYGGATLKSIQRDKINGMKYDDGKLRYSLVPYCAFKGLAEVLTFGANKYEANSWQTVPNAKERYLNALYRHIEAYRNGENKDSESGISHLSHAMTNCAFLLHFEQCEI